MQLVEKHVIKPNNPHFAEIDAASFAAKNLYNLATYHQRQRLFGGEYVHSYADLCMFLKVEDAYRSLPAQVSQQVLRMVDVSWRAYFASLKSWRKDPSRFLGKPKMPNYKDKQSGRYTLVYTNQSISSRLLRIGQIKPSGLGLIVETRQTDIAQVRIIPKKTHYVVEVIYNTEPEQHDLDFSLIAGIDIGLDNLAVVSSNKQGYKPLVVNGKPLKSINQFYNKRKAKLQSVLGSGQRSSHRIDRMTDKRNRRIEHYLHTASRRIVDHLVAEKIGNLVIGKNDGWKQEIGIGKRNNQNFVSIPHSRFIGMLTYKCELVGINVILTEESYTSKTSFLDGEEPVKHESYAGRRVKRGLFRSALGRYINADLNGAYQIIKKVAPEAFSQGVEDAAVHPSPLLVA